MENQEKSSNDALVRVFEIPAPDEKYCFGGGKPMTFYEVDWFRDEQNMMAGETGRTEIVEFIKRKRYYREGVALLVMSPVASFTIGYTARRPTP